MINKICVAGAGTMGSGIALCAAQNGLDVLIYDTQEGILEKAKSSNAAILSGMVEKGRITAEEQFFISSRMHYSHQIKDCVADLIVEAIVEKLEIKLALFSELAVINAPETIFASNTSSLSINKIQEGIPHPERVAGLHFFNPAHIMKLVEVVQGVHTELKVIEVLVGLCHQLKKSPVVCTDAPGFIVNRVARHYYLEGMRVVEQGIASLEEVDTVMEATGFKMGPFRLMDLIGNDVNLAVSTSIYEAFEKEPRFRPSQVQIEKVKSGDLGRKTGRGFYNYSK